MKHGRCKRCQVSPPDVGALLCAACAKHADVPMRVTTLPAQQRPEPRITIVSHARRADLLASPQEPAEEPAVSRRTKHRRSA